MNGDDVISYVRYPLTIICICIPIIRNTMPSQRNLNSLNLSEWKVLKMRLPPVAPLDSVSTV